MAGLLDMFGSSWDDPKSQAIMALSAGLLQGTPQGISQGLLAAGNVSSQAKNNLLKSELLKQQITQNQFANDKAAREVERERALRGLQTQYFGQQPQDDRASIDRLFSSAGNVQNAAAPDMNGYITTAVAKGLINPMDAVKMRQALSKDNPINKLDVKDFTPASVQRFAQTGNYADLERLDKLHFGDTGGALVGLNPFTGQQASSVDKTGNPYNDLVLSDGRGGVQPNNPLINAKASIANAGASNVSVNTKQEGEESKTVGKFFGENYADIQKAGFNAQNTINRYNRLGQLLDGVDTGKFAPLGLEVSKAARAVGLDVDPKLANKEAAVALSSEIALQLRNPSGGAGMPGAMSDADRNFLAGMVPGIEKTPEGRKQIIETAKKLAQRDKEVAQLAREYRVKNGSIDEGFFNLLEKNAEANPLFGDAQKTQPKEGTKSFKDYGYSSREAVLKDARATILKNPKARAEVERRLSAIGLSLEGN